MKKLEKIEKSPLESKKFIAVMIWSIAWLALTGYGIRKQLDPTVLLAMIYVNGGVQGLFLGGQSFVDAVVRKATALAQAKIPQKQSFIVKGDDE